MLNNTPIAGEKVTELHTKKEVAKKLRVTTRTIDNLTNQGVITRIKLGSSSRYNWAQILQALESQSK
jgi:excisionase family DNA binding protein